MNGSFCPDRLSFSTSVLVQYVYTIIYVRLTQRTCNGNGLGALYTRYQVPGPRFIRFPPEVIFRSRAIGTCPVTTDCIAAMS